MGVSHRRLSGWEPSQTIIYRYERVWWRPWTWFPVAATITTEAEWTPEDVRYLVASRDYEASIGSHGFPLDEATSSAANPADPNGLYYFEADPPVTDWVERARTLAAERWRETYPDQSMAGLFFPVGKRYRDRT